MASLCVSRGFLKHLNHNLPWCSFSFIFAVYAAWYAEMVLYIGNVVEGVGEDKRRADVDRGGLGAVIGQHCRIQTTAGW